MQVLHVMKQVLALSVSSFLLIGCATMRTSHSEYSQQVALGDYKKAAEVARAQKSEGEDIDDANLLPTMEAGNSYLYAKEYKESVGMLDEAEKILQYHRAQVLAGSAADYLAKILLTDAAVDYQGTITEAILLNTYKSLNYMMLNDMQSARVELNRAIDRQRRAKETYAELIGKQKEAIAEKESESGGSSTSKSLNNPEVNNIISANYSNLKDFKAYPDFVNPFTTYLAGLFFMIEGDYSKSSPLLKEAYGMVPENGTIASDFAMVENALSGRPIRDKYVWVIYENGLGPTKEELKINIPVFLVSNDVAYTGIALPKMKNGTPATVDLKVYQNSKVVASTQEVADLNRVIHTEFEYTYSDVLQRAILSAAVKTYIQYEANRVSPWAGLAATIYQAASTSADIRMWSSLPQSFQVTKILKPENSKLELKAGLHTMNVEVSPDAKYSIVYVRIPTPMSEPSVSVANF